jgi:type II secretory pathway predicted ATPase ExeA
MYKSFYHLKRSPFGISPEPDFFFPTPGHNEALAALYHAVRGHKGFAVLTGEVGTGKTLLLRCLLDRLRQSNDVVYAYVFNGLLSPSEFLQYIARDFGLPTSGKNKSEVLADLSNFVVERGTKQLTTVLIVDEAHHLSVDILEEIRLLTNLETSHDKLLQVLLVGQPELDDKLDSSVLRQLKQRVAHRARLIPLTLEETKGYIERRLKIAGAELEWSLFPSDTIARVYHYSSGIPRLVNTICENALITAFARQKPLVTPEIVEDAAADLRLNIVPSPVANELGSLSDADAVRAAKTLLELFAYLKSRPANDGPAA